MTGYNAYIDELNREVRRERARMSKSGKLTANAWRYNDCGSADPASASMDSILAAYSDAVATNNCW